jgi:hypothetical protein
MPITLPERTTGDNLLEVALSDFERRIQRLESLQTKIIPIDTFAPEPYAVLKTILATVHSEEGEYEAGWFDANIHSGGNNEEEAVRNLKGQIIDLYESFSTVPIEKLGPEPKRQLLVMRQFMQKNA